MLVLWMLRDQGISCGGQEMMQDREGVGVLMKEEISGNVVKVGRKSDRVTTIVLTLGREVVQIIWATKRYMRHREGLFLRLKWRVGLGKL